MGGYLGVYQLSLFVVKTDLNKAGSFKVKKQIFFILTEQASLTIVVTSFDSCIVEKVVNVTNGKESTVNRSLGGSTYPG